MYRVPRVVKQDPERRWSLPDRVFFAAGACHILAWVFLDRYRDQGFAARWFRPVDGLPGNHIIVVRGASAFDCLGYTNLDRRVAHMHAKANRWWPGWSCTQISLPMDVLIDGPKSRTYDGLWLREPREFLHDALPRGAAFLDRFAPPG